jgi:Cdc6-like AAA superfamily ATPase
MTPADYGLKTSYFSLDPSKDYEVFFVREKEAEEFLSLVRRTINTGRIPRFVIYGVFGIGKTHFLRYTAWKLRDVAKSIYVECPPCHRRSKFADFYSVIMRSIGRGYFLELLKKSVEELRSRGEQLSEALGINQDLASVIENTLNVDDYSLWLYFSGMKLSSKEARSIGVAHPQIDEDEAVSILNMVASLVKKFEGKQLMLLIDEAELLIRLSGDALNMFTEAIRGLTDERSKVGLIFAVTGRGLDHLPSVLTDNSVKRRIGISNYIPFEEYSESDLREFILSAISYRRIEGFDVSQKLSSISTKEHLTEKTYPFTEEAVEHIIRVIATLYKDGKIDAIRPKEALMIMDDSLAIALEDGCSVIDSSVVKRACKALEGAPI